MVVLAGVVGTMTDEIYPEEPNAMRRNANPSRSLTLCLSLGALGTLAAAPSVAQEAPVSAPWVEPAPALSPDEARAQALYQESSRYYDLGEYERALKGFQDAYVLSGAPALLLNIGQCLRFLERYDEARRSYESYLRVEPESEFRSEVENLIAQMLDLRDQKQSAQQTSAGLFGVSVWKGSSTTAAPRTNPTNQAGSVAAS
jgi:tetratricopeptide (TPR) repeat protein